MTTKQNHVPTNPATSLRLAFERVPVCGHEIDAARDGERVWISVRRVCEGLSVDVTGQLTKLRRKPWATVEMISMVAEDGKKREAACIDLDALPMWLATIDVDRVGSTSAKRLLVEYQFRAAAVLRDHFFGHMKPANDVDIERVVDAVLERRLESIAFSMRAQSDRMAAIEGGYTKVLGGLAEIAHAIATCHALAVDTNHLVRKVAARDGTIAGEDVDKLKDKVARIVEIRAAQTGVLGERRAMQAIRADVYADLFACVEWGRKGQGLAAMPAEKGPIAKAHLDYQIRKLLAGKGKRASVRAQAQTKLFDEKAN